MAIKIIEDLKALRSNTYEHGIPIDEHIASRAIKALHESYKDIDRLESEDLFLRTQLAEKDAEIERLRRALDNLKVRAYELGSKELHDMALEALKGGGK